MSNFKLNTAWSRGALIRKLKNKLISMSRVRAKTDIDISYRLKVTGFLINRSISLYIGSLVKLD